MLSGTVISADRNGRTIGQMGAADPGLKRRRFHGLNEDCAMR
jgi:hypothetical protein